MMLAAWNLGIGSCPNTPANESAVKALIGLSEEMSVPTILSLGYPARGEPRPRTWAPQREVEGTFALERADALLDAAGHSRPTLEWLNPDGAAGPLESP